MPYKIFVSYKYSDNNVYPIKQVEDTVRSYVDELERYFDRTDNIYKGESDNEDLSEYSDDQIWEKLKDRIFDSTITIVMISPMMKLTGKKDEAQWIPWEISFSLKETTRSRTSHSNAVLAIVLPDSNNSYDYFITNQKCGDCACRIYNTNTLFNILSSNMFNAKELHSNGCTKLNVYTGNHSYIITVEWAKFITDIKYYLEAAVKNKEQIEDFEIVKSI